MGFIGLFLIVSLLLYGVLWAKTDPQNSCAVVVNGFAAIFALFVYAGLMVGIKPKAKKTALIIVILVTLIGLTLAVLKFWLA